MVESLASASDLNSRGTKVFSCGPSRATSRISPVALISGLRRLAPRGLCWDGGVSGFGFRSELAGHEGVFLRAFPSHQPDITCGTDLGVEEVGSPRALLGWWSLWLRLGGVGLPSTAGLPCRLSGGRPDGCEIVGRVRSLGRRWPGGRARRAADLSERGQLALEGLNLRGESVGHPVSRGTRNSGPGRRRTESGFQRIDARR